VLQWDYQIQSTTEIKPNAHGGTCMMRQTHTFTKAGATAEHVDAKDKEKIRKE